jgi:hypothetical protein
MHRLIMSSTVYRQSSLRNPSQDAVDSSNALYGRYPVRRLDAEALRDRILAVSGRLDPTPFGPPVPVSEDAVGQAIPEGNSSRRSIYLQTRRSRPVSFLVTFDAPVMDVNCDRRSPSTSALQALMLMNSDFLIAEAIAMADRLIAETPADLAPAESWDTLESFRGATGATLPQMIAHAWALAYQRPIEPEELELARSFVAGQLDAMGSADAPEDRPKAVLTHLCHQLLSSNEFLYVD